MALSGHGAESPDSLGATPTADNDGAASKKLRTDTTRAGTVSALVPVDTALLRFVTGRDGTTRREIESLAQVSLTIPGRHDGSPSGAASVEVAGPSQEAVDLACTRIHTALREVVESPALGYTHFVSIPLAQHPGLCARVAAVRDTVVPSLAPARRGGIDDSIFVNPATFHLTVLMLKLWSEERVRRAAEALEAALPRVQEALQSQPMRIRLPGLTVLRGSPAKAHVLYARVEETDGRKRLEPCCRALRAAFHEAGLVMERDWKQPLKLHATIMNTSHRRGPHRRRIPFDATGILEACGNEDWGEYTLQEVHLSQRFKFDEHGYYHCCGKLPFPNDMDKGQ